MSEQCSSSEIKYSFNVHFLYIVLDRLMRPGGTRVPIRNVMHCHIPWAPIKLWAGYIFQTDALITKCSLLSQEQNLWPHALFLLPCLQSLTCQPPTHKRSTTCRVRRRHFFPRVAMTTSSTRVYITWLKYWCDVARFSGVASHVLMDLMKFAVGGRIDLRLMC